MVGSMNVVHSFSSANAQTRPPEFSKKVDMKKVNIDIMKQYVALSSNSPLMNIH